MNNPTKLALSLPLYFITLYSCKLWGAMGRLKLISSFDGDVTAHVVNIRKESTYFIFRSCKSYLVYEYTIAGNVYKKESLWKYQIVQNPDVGEEVDMKYDTKNPEECAISKEAVILTGYAIVYASIVIIFLVLFLLLIH